MLIIQHLVTWRILSFLLAALSLIRSSSSQESSQLHPCPNGCSGHGRCTSPSRVCECFQGYTGGDCSLRVCPSGTAWSDIALSTDNAHNFAECSNMGVCDRVAGACQCREGFEGVACERQSCPQRCNGVGECLSLNVYARIRDPGEGSSLLYDTPWDANKIFGCKCDDGYFGTSCALRHCPSGDDPLTGTVDISSVNPLQVNEIQRITCRADGGSFTLSFRGYTSADIAFNAKSSVVQSIIEGIESIGGKGTTKVVFAGSPQACSESGLSSFTVEFLQSFGDVPMLVADQTKLSYSSSLSSALVTVAEVMKGTKEDAACSSRGLCDISTGVCSCEPDFDTSNGYNAAGLRGDCGYTTAKRIAVCPGILACSAHGRCAGPPTYKCACSNDWTGADCSERTCPRGLAWFAYPSAGDNEGLHDQYMECSGAGDCDRQSGSCVCRVGFSGAACDRLDCPRGQSSDGNEVAVCSGHGQCLDMASLALLQTDNGDATNITYGTTPNNVLTWDFDRVFGCACDSGYEGFDCSLRSCPVGPDPLITAQDEQQLLSCTDSDKTGSVVLTFRQQSTSSISATATVSDVESALNALTSIGRVVVEVYETGANNTLCQASGSTFLVTFKGVHGQLPSITATTLNIDTFTITEYQEGTKADIVCSGRGICNHDEGLCECFAGFGSSDMDAGIGSHRDCGYVLPILPPNLLPNKE